MAARENNAAESLVTSPVAEAAEQEAIHVHGARVHNLKNISFDIPHNAITRGHRGFRVGQIEPGV